MNELPVLLMCAGAIVVAYTYLGYPLFLLLHRPRRPVTTQRTDAKAPSVAVVIAVHNEEECIGARISNLLESAYPDDQLTILIGSDASSDGTNVILERIHNPRIQVKLFPVRRGKAAVLNDLIDCVHSDIIVFSDANTLYDRGCIAALVHGFQDPMVGGVCGELRLRSDAPDVRPSSETTYWSYESFIKRREGMVSSTIGATGAVYAVRRGLVRRLPTETVVADDLMQSLHVISQGRRFSYEPAAVAYESPAESVVGEMRRRVRIGAGNIAAVKPYLELLSPRHGYIALGLLSHKILRWVVPFALAMSLLSAIAHVVMNGALPLHIWSSAALAGWFILGWILERFRRPAGIGGLLYYVVVVNAGLGWGLLRGLFGRLEPSWSKITRSSSEQEGRPS